MRRTVTTTTETVYELSQEEVEQIIRDHFRSGGPALGIDVDLDGSGQRICCIVRIKAVANATG